MEFTKKLETDTWVIEGGEGVSRQAQKLGVIGSSESAVVRLKPLAQQTGNLVIKGTITCHGCSTSIPFESDIWGMTGGGRKVTCSNCGNQLSDGEATDEVDGIKYIFFYIKPWTHIAGQEIRQMEMNISSLMTK